MFAAIARPKDACPSTRLGGTLPAPSAPSGAPMRLALHAPLVAALARRRAAARRSRRDRARRHEPRRASCDGVVLRSKPGSSAPTARGTPWQQDARVVAPEGRRRQAGTRSAGGGPTRAGPGTRSPALNGKSRQEAARPRGPCTGRRACSTSSTGRSRPPAAASGCAPRPHGRADEGPGWRPGVGVSASGTVTGGEVDRRLRRPVSPATAGTGSREMGGRQRVLCTASRRCARRAARGGRRIGASAAARDVRLHRGHRRQPLAGDDQLAKVAAAGKKFAFMKASEDTRLRRPDVRDEPRPGERERLKVGAYHFAQARTPPPATPSPRPTTSSPQRPGRAATCSPCSTSSCTGGLSDAQLQPGQGVPRPRLRPDRRAGDDLHVAQLLANNMGDTQTVRRTPATGPLDRPLDDGTRRRRVPATNWGGNGWTFWQYTSDGTWPDLRPGRPRPLPLRTSGRPRSVAGRRAHRLDCSPHGRERHAPVRRPPRRAPARARTRSSTSSARR